MIRFGLGMELALPPPSDWAPYSLESLAAAVVHQVGIEGDDYELRLLLPWDADVDCPHDVTEGEMLFVVAPGVGGPVAAEKLAPVAAEANAIGRTGELDDSLAPLLTELALGAKRMLFLPPYFDAQLARPQAAKALEGVAYVPAKDLRSALTPELCATPGIAQLAALADLTRRTRVVLSARVA